MDKHIKKLDKKMLNFASKLEFEDAAKIRDEINRLKAKQIGIKNKLLELKNWLNLFYFQKKKKLELYI